MPKCKICNKTFQLITGTHLKGHKISVRDYKKKYGAEGVGFGVSASVLPSNDPRYINWRNSLKKRPQAWNKGHRKDTHPGVARISATMKSRKIDNFSDWREKMKNQGLIKTDYPDLFRDGNLAELIGVVWGDGHIAKFPRTEGLTIISNSNNPGFIDRYSKMVEMVFDKVPTVAPRNDSNCTYIRIYEKYISKRMRIPSGRRHSLDIKTPYWIRKDKEFLRRCLRGLYEAEGSLSTHKPTYTHKFCFSNKNKSLLDFVFNSLENLGFHPHRTSYNIQISKKREVYKCRDLIRFRNYDNLPVK